MSAKKRRPPPLASVQRWNDSIKATQWLLAKVLDEIAPEQADKELERMAEEVFREWDVSGERRPPSPPRKREPTAAFVRALAERLRHCGERLWVYRCAHHGETKTVCECCHVPFCPRYQRRYLRRWVHRVGELEKRIKQKKLVVRKEKNWKVITVSLRQRGSVQERVDATVALRAALCRLLRERYGMVAGLVAIELGEHNNVHIHGLVLSDYVPRVEVERWLRSRDCRVKKCHHPADDRCAKCKAAGESPETPFGRNCTHPEQLPDGKLRWRCTGSCVVDIRAPYK